ncbi:hypothetical protein DSM03_11149 [Leeuwenhoekiella aestuarii]|uniref:Uncharacterized protein n=1 Tax=Leeuwenhoekiella aestuarii TaxID=2249426 RepID=A0A4Q0NNE8_9FLAO|nr:hypothetical protein DSM04_11146 [Leeuwenhoekiella aestuarii]RXG12175.1 hypothetical protein DSM03_11149 [Leeuwenhoekiella aestuarii]
MFFTRALLESKAYLVELQGSAEDILIHTLILLTAKSNEIHTIALEGLALQ